MRKKESYKKNTEIILGSIPSTRASEMSSRIKQFDNERTTEWSSQNKIIDTVIADMRGKYVLRPQLSWTGLYGKVPWPRVKKQWEKV
jgi:hypothetical protein